MMGRSGMAGRAFSASPEKDERRPEKSVLTGRFLGQKLGATGGVIISASSALCSIAPSASLAVSELSGGDGSSQPHGLASSLVKVLPSGTAASGAGRGRALLSQPYVPPKRSSHLVDSPLADGLLSRRASLATDQTSQALIEQLRAINGSRVASSVLQEDKSKPVHDCGGFGGGTRRWMKGLGGALNGAAGMNSYLTPDSYHRRPSTEHKPQNEKQTSAVQQKQSVRHVIPATLPEKTQAWQEYAAQSGLVAQGSATTSSGAAASCVPPLAQASAGPSAAPEQGKEDRVRADAGKTGGRKARTEKRSLVERQRAKERLERREEEAALERRRAAMAALLKSIKMQQQQQQQQRARRRSRAHVCESASESASAVLPLGVDDASIDSISASTSARVSAWETPETDKMLGLNEGAVLVDASHSSLNWSWPSLVPAASSAAHSSPPQREPHESEKGTRRPSRRTMPGPSTKSSRTRIRASSSMPCSMSPSPRQPTPSACARCVTRSVLSERDPERAGAARRRAKSVPRSRARSAASSMTSSPPSLHASPPTKQALRSGRSGGVRAVGAGGGVKAGEGGVSRNKASSRDLVQAGASALQRNAGDTVLDKHVHGRPLQGHKQPVALRQLTFGSGPLTGTECGQVQVQGKDVPHVEGAGGMDWESMLLAAEQLLSARGMEEALGEEDEGAAALPAASSAHAAPVPHKSSTSMHAVQGRQGRQGGEAALKSGKTARGRAKSAPRERGAPRSAASSVTSSPPSLHASPPTKQALRSGRSGGVRAVGAGGGVKAGEGGVSRSSSPPRADKGGAGMGVVGTRTAEEVRKFMRQKKREREMREREARLAQEETRRKQEEARDKYKRLSLEHARALQADARQRLSERAAVRTEQQQQQQTDDDRAIASAARFSRRGRASVDKNFGLASICDIVPRISRSARSSSLRRSSAVASVPKSNAGQGKRVTHALAHSVGKGLKKKRDSRLAEEEDGQHDSDEDSLTGWQSKDVPEASPMRFRSAEILQDQEQRSQLIVLLSERMKLDKLQQQAGVAAAAASKGARAHAGSALCGPELEELEEEEDDEDDGEGDGINARTDSDDEGYRMLRSTQNAADKLLDSLMVSASQPSTGVAVGASGEWAMGNTSDHGNAGDMVSDDSLESDEPGFDRLLALRGSKEFTEIMVQVNEKQLHDNAQGANDMSAHSHSDLGHKDGSSSSSESSFNNTPLKRLSLHSSQNLSPKHQSQNADVQPSPESAVHVLAQADHPKSPHLAGAMHRARQVVERVEGTLARQESRDEDSKDARLCSPSVEAAVKGCEDSPTKKDYLDSSQSEKAMNDDVSGGSNTSSDGVLDSPVTSAKHVAASIEDRQTTRSKFELSVDTDLRGDTHGAPEAAANFPNRLLNDAPAHKQMEDLSDLSESPSSAAWSPIQSAATLKGAVDVAVLKADRIAANATALVKRSMAEEEGRCKQQFTLLRLREENIEERAQVELETLRNAKAHMQRAWNEKHLKGQSLEEAILGLEDKERSVRKRLAEEKAQIAQTRVAIRRQRSAQNKNIKTQSDALLSMRHETYEIKNQAGSAFVASEERSPANRRHDGHAHRVDDDDDEYLLNEVFYKAYEGDAAPGTPSSLVATPLSKANRGSPRHLSSSPSSKNQASKEAKNASEETQNANKEATSADQHVARAFEEQTAPSPLKSNLTSFSDPDSSSSSPSKQLRDMAPKNLLQASMDEIIKVVGGTPPTSPTKSITADKIIASPKGSFEHSVLDTSATLQASSPPLHSAPREHSSASNEAASPARHVSRCQEPVSVGTPGGGATCAASSPEPLVRSPVKSPAFPNLSPSLSPQAYESQKAEQGSYAALGEEDIHKQPATSLVHEEGTPMQEVAEDAGGEVCVSLANDKEVAGKSSGAAQVTMLTCLLRQASGQSAVQVASRARSALEYLAMKSADMQRESDVALFRHDSMLKAISQEAVPARKGEHDHGQEMSSHVHADDTTDLAGGCKIPQRATGNSMHEGPCTTEQTGAEEESEEDLDVEEGEEEADDAWFRDAEEEGYGDKDVEAEEARSLAQPPLPQYVQCVEDLQTDAREIGDDYWEDGEDDQEDQGYDEHVSLADRVSHGHGGQDGMGQACAAGEGVLGAGEEKDGEQGAEEDMIEEEIQDMLDSDEIEEDMVDEEDLINGDGSEEADAPRPLISSASPASHQPPSTPPKASLAQSPSHFLTNASSDSSGIGSGGNNTPGVDRCAKDGDSVSPGTPILRNKSDQGGDGHPSANLSHPVAAVSPQLAAWGDDGCRLLPSGMEETRRGQGLSPSAHSPQLSPWADETCSSMSKDEPCSSMVSTLNDKASPPQSTPSTPPTQSTPKSPKSPTSPAKSPKSPTLPSPLKTPSHMQVTSHGGLISTSPSSDVVSGEAASALDASPAAAPDASSPAPRAAAGQKRINAASSLVASPPRSSKHGGLAARAPPEHVRIEQSPPRCRDSRSRSVSPSTSPSPSRRRGAAATAIDLPPPSEHRTPSPRSPRVASEPEALAVHGVREAALVESALTANATLPDTPAGQMQAVSDAATAVMFAQEVLQGVDDAILEALLPLNVQEHFLKLAKARSSLPDWQHIFHKLLFDLLNEEMATMRTEEVRRRRGRASFRLGSDSAYGMERPAPRMQAEHVRKDLLLRVAKKCAVGEPVVPSLSAEELAEANAAWLESAIEQSVLQMEEEWLCCDEEEDAVVLAVVEALFDDLVADSALAFLTEGDVQLLREEEDHISQQQLGGHGSEMMGIYDALEGSLGGACMSTIPESGFCGNGLLAKFELGTETP